METSPQICRPNQRTGFYMIGTFVMKELRKALLLFKNAQTSFIELKLSRRKYASSSRTYTYSLKTFAYLIKAFFLKPQNLSIL